MGDPERSGGYPMVSGRPSPPPAPPDGTPERGVWVAREVRSAVKVAHLALDAVMRIEESVGYSPDPAKGIKDGKGIAGQLSTIIAQNDRVAQNSAARRNILIGVSIAVGVIVGLLGIVRALVEFARIAK